MMESYGIFPEGTRKGLIKTGEIKRGSILIGIKKKIPVIPIGITYEEKGLRKKVIISIGKKMDVFTILFLSKMIEYATKKKMFLNNIEYGLIGIIIYLTLIRNNIFNI